MLPQNIFVTLNQMIFCVAVFFSKKAALQLHCAATTSID